ncbi:MAG: Rrf2 family transcriptional regulator [Myxococcota bacterium]
MKLSSKTRYGIRALFDIAFHADGGPTQIKDIAERQEIPPRFLEQIFQDLKRAGLVSSKRGPKGGYQLAVAPETIRIGDIVRTLEGPTVMTGSEETSSATRAVTDETLRELAVQVEAVLDGITIEDLCVQGDNRGLRRDNLRRYVYSI